MVSETNYRRMPEVVIEYPETPSSACPPPPRWWHRPILTFPAEDDREPTPMESAALYSPCYGGLLTLLAIFLILFFVNKAHCHAKFSIQSISVSPSSATWHVDFLVKNPPRSTYSIYYDDDDASVRLGPINAAVLYTSHKPHSRDHTTAFSLEFVAENATVSEQLDITLRAKHKLYVISDVAGHVVISCHNLTQRRHNVDKIECYSSFTSSSIYRV